MYGINILVDKLTAIFLLLQQNVHGHVRSVVPCPSSKLSMNLYFNWMQSLHSLSACFTWPTIIVTYEMCMYDWTSVTGHEYRQQ
jgi:hypothetical protein